MTEPNETEMRRALLAGLSGYLIWGISPLYFQRPCRTSAFSTH